MLVEPKLEARPYEVLKWSPGFPRRVLVLSPLCGVNTHFLGSSKICGGDSCPACRAGIPAKYAGYVAVLFESTVRLLRLTSASAFLGQEQGQYVPGRILDVVKHKERKPLQIVQVGDSLHVDVSSVISRVELLSSVAALHGLPRFDASWPIERCLKLIVKNACTSVRLAMEGRVA